MENDVENNKIQPLSFGNKKIINFPEFVSAKTRIVASANFMALLQWMF